MAAKIEVTRIGRRYSYAPVVALLVLASMIAATYVVTRPAPASSERTQSATSFGLGRDVLVAAGYTGRLGGVAIAEWRPAAQVAGFTGRLGAATESSVEDWTRRAIRAGFTGQVGASTQSVTEGVTDWARTAKRAGFTGRLGS
jgi:hypothetical protein